MNELIVHHQYAMGSTFDLSRHGNHGVPSDVAVGAGSYSSSYLFESENSRILVLPSATLENPFSVAAMVRFRVDTNSLNQRQNLIEGYLSFALYIQPGGSLAGTIVNSAGTWQGFTTNKGVVAPDVWHEAWLIHNGISSIQLQLDGLVVGQYDTVIGPVRSVGDLGLSIGNWPDLGAYPLHGYIDEVKVYRYDPLKDLNKLLDRCCFDGRRLDSALKTLRESGVLSSGSESGSEILNSMLRVAVVISQIQEPNPIFPKVRRLWNALLRRQPKGTEIALLSFVSDLKQNASAQLLPLLERFFMVLRTNGLDETTLKGLSLAFNKCTEQSDSLGKEVR